jgi:intraflagellar transport protein 80
MIGKPISHSADISEISLNKNNFGAGRQLIIVDKNRDMYITKTQSANILHKLANMVKTFRWNDDNDLLAAIVDTKFVIWYYPTAIFIDDDIALLSRYEIDGSVYGSSPQIVSFDGSGCKVRRSDGATMAVSNMSPFPKILQEFAKQKEWEKAIRLCRRVKNRELWAALAAMSMDFQELNTAEVAYAALEEVI